MNQRRTCSFVFAILGSFLIYPPDPSTTKASKIDQLVSEYQQCGYFNGSILVAEHGKVLYERGVGYADIQAHTPNTPKTKFGIASLSKQFTAALVLMQVAIGNLRLDATVSEILPWYRRDPGSRTTIEQLLRHTSGLPPDYDAPEFGDGRQAGLGEWGYGWFVKRIAVGQPGGGGMIAEMRGDMPGNFFASILRSSEMDTGLPKISSRISKRYYLTANRALLEEARWIFLRMSVGRVGPGFSATASYRASS